MQKSNYSLSYKLRKLIFSSRPISWINTAFPFAAAYLALGGPINTFFLLATFYFLIPYNILIYVVNDVYDYESDLRNPRKSSIEGGLLEPELHKFMLSSSLLINLIFIIPILFLSNSNLSDLFLLMISIGAVIYSAPPLRTKEKPFLDSMTSSFHFVSPMIFAMLLCGWQTIFIGYVSSFFLWGCASHMFGAVQDISSDRKAKISSIATYLGAKSTARLSLVLYLLSSLLISLYGFPQLAIGLVILLYAITVLPYINLTDNDCERANKGWRKFLLLNQLTGATITITLVLSHVIK